MTVAYTPQQYEALMKLVYLGNWMINGIKISDEHVKKFNDIEQQIFSKAEEAGCGSLVEYDKSFKKYFPTQELEEDKEIASSQKEYNNEIFWAELIERLAQRDFVVQYGVEAIKTMGEREQKEKFSECVKRYVDEFEKNELKNIFIHS